MSNAFSGHLYSHPQRCIGKSFARLCVCLFTWVLSRCAAEITLTHIHTAANRVVTHLAGEKSCSVLDDLMPSTVSRKIVVLGI